MLARLSGCGGGGGDGGGGGPVTQQGVLEDGEEQGGFLGLVLFGGTLSGPIFSPPFVICLFLDLFFAWFSFLTTGLLMIIIFYYSDQLIFRVWSKGGCCSALLTVLIPPPPPPPPSTLPQPRSLWVKICRFDVCRLFIPPLQR